MKKDRTKYNQEYYTKNIREIKKRKAERYKENEEGYRDRALVRSRVSSILSTLKNDEDKSYVKFNGKKESAHYISYIADLIGRSIVTLRTWVKKSYIPKALYKDRRGNKLYTKSQALYLMSFLKMVDNTSVKITPKDLKSGLIKVWKKPFSMREFEKTLRGLKIV